MRRSLCRLLESDIPNGSWEVVNLPFSIGGLGLRCSSRVSPAVYWASCADCHTVHPVLGDQIEAALSRGEPGQHWQAAVRCREQLLDVGMEAPLRGAVPRNDLDGIEPGVKHGWQFQAPQKVEDCHLSGAMWPRISGPSRALLRSQGGPIAGLPFSVFSSCVVSGSFCLVPLATAGVGVHSIPVASAACEVAGVGASWWRAQQHLSVGKQAPEFRNVRFGLAGCAGQPSCSSATGFHTRCAEVDGAVVQAARRRNETTCPELSGQFGRPRLVVLGCEVASKWSDECLSFLRQLARAKVRSEPPHLKVRARRAWLSRWSIVLQCCLRGRFVFAGAQGWHGIGR